ncbi:MAG: DNA/RNA non-specific endonuclease [Bacteroidales bacterium]
MHTISNRYIDGRAVSRLLIGFLLLLAGCRATGDLSYEIPRYGSHDQIIRHYAYTLCYSEEWEQAKWVAYDLTLPELESRFGRTDRFLEDPLVITQSANANDYKGSGYDRGHLAPAADMQWDSIAMRESFYFSNISPQLPGFNRGIWKELETKVRQWAEKYEKLYITTGPVCYDSDSAIGASRVRVPTHFYKAVLVYNDTLKTGIGFLFPHQKISGDIFDYAVTIDDIEDLTGLDLYPNLPDRFEKKIESEFDKSFWDE